MSSNGNNTGQGGRPLTSRTRKRMEQLEDDQDLARVLALEEDEKIAAKLQRDFENGLESDDYHRVNSRGELVPRQDEFPMDSQQGRPRNDKSPSILRKSGVQIGEGGSELSSAAASPEPPSLANSSKYELQRASFSTRLSSPSTSNQKHKKGPSSSAASHDDQDGEEEGEEESDFDNGSVRRPGGASGDFHKGSGSAADEESTSASALSSKDNFKSLESEMKALIDMIGLYQPEQMELETRLIPFVPDYIPAIGDIDPIIKVSMPATINGQATKKISDGLLKKQDSAGIIMLDEPNSMQSDPGVVDLALRSISLQESSEASLKIRSIQLHSLKNDEVSVKNSGGGVKTLQKWIDTVMDLHTSKNSSSASIKGMPTKDLESLMSEWPEAIDAAISSNQIPLPSSDIDLSLKDYVQLCCNILDIPIKPIKSTNRGTHKQYVDGLAILFTIYSEFQSNQHFTQR